MDASAELFRRQGYTGTGLKQILATAEAPFGSRYHFFPGGKEQLGAEVIRWSGLGYQRLVEAVLDAAPDVVAGVGDVFAGAAEPLRQATAEVFVLSRAMRSTEPLEVAGTATVTAVRDALASAGP